MPIDRAGLSGILGAFQPSPSARGARSGSTARPGRASAQSERPRRLEDELARIAAAFRVDDASSLDAARERVVRVLLQDEFGSEIREHPRYGEIVDSICEALRARPDVDGRLRALLAPGNPTMR